MFGIAGTVSWRLYLGYGIVYFQFWMLDLVCWTVNFVFWVIFLFSVDHLKFGMMLALMAGEESTIRSW